MWGPTNGTKEGGLFPLSTSFKAPFGLIFTVPSKECFSRLWPKALIFTATSSAHSPPPPQPTRVLFSPHQQIRSLWLILFHSLFFFSKFFNFSVTTPSTLFWPFYVALIIIIFFFFFLWLVRLISKYSCSFKRWKLWLGL